MSTTLEMYRGDTDELTLTATSGTAALDLTGASIRFTVKTATSQPDADALIVKTVGSGVTITNGTAGIATIAIGTADTTSLAYGKDLVWDVQVTKGGVVKTLSSGIFRVTADVSRTSP